MLLKNSTTLGHCCAPPGHWLRTRVATINSKPRTSVSSTKQATPADSEETWCCAALTDRHSCNGAPTPLSPSSLHAGMYCVWGGGVYTVQVCVQAGGRSVCMHVCMCVGGGGTEALCTSDKHTVKCWHSTYICLLCQVCQSSEVHLLHPHHLW